MPRYAAQISSTLTGLRRTHAADLGNVGLIDGRYYIRDLGSKNGTLVNGTRVGNTGVRLKSGDKIELVQDQVVLRFQERTITMTFPPSSEAASSGALAVDVPSRDVYVQGTRVEPPLSRKEFDVLQYLFAHLGQACSKDDIASHGWPERQKGDVGDNEIDQCIRRIRLRIERDSSNPRYLLTMRGYGYKLSM